MEDFEKQDSVTENKSAERQKFIEEEKEFFDEEYLFLSTFIAAARGENIDFASISIPGCENSVNEALAGKRWRIDAAFRNLREIINDNEHNLTLEEIGYTPEQISALEHDIASIHNEQQHQAAEVGLQQWRNDRERPNLTTQDRDDSIIPLAEAVVVGNLDIEHMGLTQREQGYLSASINNAKKEAIRRYSFFKDSPNAANTRIGKVQFSTVKKLIMLSGVTAEDLQISEDELNDLKSDAPKVTF